MELCRITVADNPDLRGGAKGQHSGVSLTKGVIDGAHRDGAHRPLRFTMAVGNADARVGDAWARLPLEVLAFGLFITTSCEGVHCAFVWFLVAWRLRGSEAPGSDVGAGHYSFCALQKAKEGLEFNNLTTKACIFLAVQFIQG